MEWEKCGVGEVWSGRCVEWVMCTAGDILSEGHTRSAFLIMAIINDHYNLMYLHLAFLQTVLYNHH